MKSRDYQIDSIKGLLIILVVFGHLLLANTKENNWMLTLIYSFHMPAFIFLNGVFSKNVNLRKVLRFGILYFFIQVIYILVVNVTSYPWIPKTHIIVTPIFHVWYLLSLTFWYLISVFIKKFNLNPFVVLPVTIIFSLIIRYANFNVDGNYMAYQRTIVFAPYFIAGHFITLSNLTQARVKLRKFKLFLYFMMVIFILTNFLYFGKNADEWMKMFFGYVNYYQFSNGKSIFFLKEILQYIIGTAAIVLLLGLVPKTKGVLSYLGQHTMYIFICHPIIYFIVYNHINRNSIITIERYCFSTMLSILAIIFSLIVEQIVLRIGYLFRRNI